MRPLVRIAAALAVAFAFFFPAIPARAQDRPDPEDVRIEKLDLRDLPLTDACRLLADRAGLNIVPSAEAGARKVTLYLRDVNALAALAALCKAQQLWFQRDPVTGIVRIHTAEEYRLDLVTVQEEQTEFFTLLYPNAMDVGYAIRNLYGARVVLRFGSDDRDVVEELEDRLERLDVLDDGAVGLGSRLLGNFGGTGGTAFGGQGASSGSRTDRDTERERNDPNSFTDRPVGGSFRDDGATDFDRRLAESGEDPAQRAALVAAARTQQAPVYVTVARRQNKVIVRTGDPRALEQIRTLVSRLDTPTPLVLLEVRILSVELEDGQTSFFEYAWANDNIAGSFIDGRIGNAGGPGQGPSGTGLRAGDLTFQYVNAHFAARLQVLETEGRVRTLSTPLLLTANNEASRLFVGREVPLNRSFSGGQAIATDGVTTTTPGTTAIEFRPVGTTLLVTPNINSDRTVTLRIVQEASDVDSSATVLVPTSTGFTPQVVSVVSSQSVSGTIVAKSEMAVAFGGLIEKGTLKDEEKVPFLGDIPILGIPFRRSVNRETRREIVVVVRPYVITTPAEAESQSRKLLGGLGADPESMEGGAPGADGKGPAFRIHGVDRE